MHNVDAIAVRLADEGVPLRAIARATNTPSDQLRAKLREAHDEGRLLDLPKEDWPPGFPRDQRALQLSRMVTQNPEAVTLAASRVFGLTATEVSLLAIGTLWGYGYQLSEPHRRKVMDLILSRVQGAPA
jgi:hypothetical protein